MSENNTLRTFEITGEQCRDIIDRALKVEPMKAAVGGYRNIDETKRISTIRWLLRGAGFDDVFAVIDNVINECATEFGFIMNEVAIHEIQFTEYGEGGHYDWHVDDFFQAMRETTRKLSVTLLLNDDFEGGGFCYVNWRCDLSAGMGIVFPSMMPHIVEPVTKGTRYSIVAWAEGPEWK